MRKFVSILILMASTAGATNLPCPVLLGGGEAAVGETTAGRWLMRVPPGLRKWRRQRFPQVNAGDLGALHARLATLIPFDLVTPVMRSSGRIYPESFAAGKDARGKKRWMIDFVAARQILEEILEVSATVHGLDSEEVGLTHFSMSVFFELASNRPATFRAPKRDIYLDMKTESNEFDDLSLHHAEKAYQTLRRAKSPFAPFARLHWVKQLDQMGEWMCSDNHFGLCKGPPVEGYEEVMAIAEREARALEAEIETYGLTPEMSAWFRVNAIFLSLSMKQTRRSVEAVRSGDYSQRSYPTGYVELIRFVVDHPEALPRLLADGHDGVLHDLINKTRWWFQWLEMNSVKQKMFEIEEAIRSKGGMTPEEFLEKIRAIDEFGLSKSKTPTPESEVGVLNH